MGLTRTSTGKHSIVTNTPALKSDPGDIVIALAGNPNGGKSTVFKMCIRDRIITAPPDARAENRKIATVLKEFTSCLLYTSHGYRTRSHVRL